MPRKTIEFRFENDSKKQSFESRLQQATAATGSSSISEALPKILDSFLATVNNSCDSDSTTTSEGLYTQDTLSQEQQPMPATGTSSPEETASDSTTRGMPPQFVGTTSSLQQLVDITRNHAQQCEAALKFEPGSMVGHVYVSSLTCASGHKYNWASSSAMHTNYTANYRLFLAFLCSGMLTNQYERFSQFAEIGTVSDKLYRQLVITMSAIVHLLYYESTTDVVREEQKKSQDAGMSGISIMTDARHQCRKNSYHTDMVALGCLTHKVVNKQHISKKDENSSQKHEKLGVERMYADFEKADIVVEEHVHDRNNTVNKSVREKENVHNSNDRWHAARSAVKGMKKITSGPKYTMNKAWHPQLSDKISGVRKHIYWAMDQCEGSPTKLCELLDSIPLHYQDIHTSCHHSQHARNQILYQIHILLLTP